MFKRKLVSQLITRLKEPRQFIQIVVGPRQTGKTTAVLQALREVDTMEGRIKVERQAVKLLKGSITKIFTSMVSGDMTTEAFSSK